MSRNDAILQVGQYMHKFIALYLTCVKSGDKVVRYLIVNVIQNDTEHPCGAGRGMRRDFRIRAIAENTNKWGSR